MGTYVMIRKSLLVLLSFSVSAPILAEAPVRVEAPVSAEASTTVEMTVHTTKGSVPHSAPMLGKAPMTLEGAMQAAGVPYTATWFPNVPGYAAMIIDGEPATTTGQLASPFWWACIDGYSSAAGLQTLVRAGNRVDWTWGSNVTCPKDSGH